MPSTAWRSTGCSRSRSPSRTRWRCSTACCADLHAVPLAPEELGRPSRRAAQAAMEAHRAVLKGSPIRLAISRALAERPELGGKERRFAALAARELSRHQRLLDLHAKELGRPPGQADLL